MSNIYRYQFVSHCPNNQHPIIYSLEIETDEVIHVEHIVTAAALKDEAYHEEIADDMPRSSAIRWYAQRRINSPVLSMPRCGFLMR